LAGKNNKQVAKENTLRKDFYNAVNEVISNDFYKFYNIFV
jgi:hypothetical protein